MRYKIKGISALRAKYLYAHARKRARAQRRDCKQSPTLSSRRSEQKSDAETHTHAAGRAARLRLAARPGTKKQTKGRLKTAKITPSHASLVRSQRDGATSSSSSFLSQPITAAITARIKSRILRRRDLLSLSITIL